MTKHRPAPQPVLPIPLTDRLPPFLLAATVALVVATPLIPSEGAASEGTHAAWCMLWCLLLLAWSGLNLLRPGIATRFGWTDAAFIALVVLHSASAIITGLRGGARPALNMLWIWVSYGICIFLLRQQIQSIAQGRALLVVMSSLAICLATHGYYQYFVSQPALRKAYEANPKAMLRAAGLSENPTPQEEQQFGDRIRSREPLATFALTNSLGGFLAPWMILVAGIALAQWGRGGDLKIVAAALIGAAFLAGCLLLTKSRTAMLAALAGGVLLLLYGRVGGLRIGWKIPVIAAGVLVLLGLGVVAAGGLDAQVLSEAPKSILFRIEYWRSTAAMILDYPLWGCGPGNFQGYYPRYKLPQASETIQDPHNFLLEIWATAGTPALLALLAMMAAFAVEVAKVVKLRGSWHANGTPAEGPKPVVPIGGVGAIYWGAVLGVPLGAGISLLSDRYVFDTLLGGMVGILVLGIPTAAIFLYLLRDWVKSGPLPTATPVVALAVLLINLLAAGAAGFPGVALTAWVLIPVALLSPGEPGGVTAIQRWLTPAMFVVSAALVAACYFTEYSPVLYGQMQIATAPASPLPEQVDRILEAAERADRWASGPSEQRAQQCLDFWLQTGRQEFLEHFTTAADEYRRREVPSYRASQARGRWYLQLHAKTRQPPHLEEALAAFREAASRFPNGALVHAQLAWVWKLSGDEAAAQMEAQEALRLDALNPHSEYKLKVHHLLDPQWSGALGRMTGEVRPETAEQTMRELRKGLRENGLGQP